MRGAHGIEAVRDFLEREHAVYQLIEHAATYAAREEARASGGTFGRMAKTVVLCDDGVFRMAVIPASERLDLRKARVLLGAGGHLRLATEEEIEREFPAFEVGAVPPFGALVGTPEVIDRRLLARDHVLCSGGDHRHTLELAPAEMQRLGSALVGDLCKPHGRPAHTHRPEGVDMSATRTPVPPRGVTAAARARAEADARRVDHVMESLEAAQKDIGAIGGTLGTGVRDLRRDATRLLRDARRDLLKMRKAVQRDLDRLQKDLTTAATAKPPAARRGSTATKRTATRRTTAAAH